MNHEEQEQQNTQQPVGPAFETHYTPQQIAKLWHVNEKTVRTFFIEEPGVLKFGMPSLVNRGGRRRGHITLRIPASVLERVYARKTGSLTPLLSRAR